MDRLQKLEREALNLPAREREALVLSMWDSLESAPDFDPEGIELALARDAEIESGKAQTISRAEFQRRTRGGE